MTRILKWIGIVLAALAVLLMVLMIVINIIPGDTYKSLISSGVKSATGRELAIEGEFDISLFTSLAIKASDITLANADWGTQPHMASIAHIEGKVALFPILKGILDATLVVDQPDIRLETDGTGRANWQFGPPTEDAPPATEKTDQSGGFPLRPRIRKLHLNGTHFVLHDSQKGDQINFQSEKLHIGEAEKGLTLDFAGKYNDIPVALAGGLDRANFFAAMLPANINLDGHVGDAQLAAAGTVGPLVPDVNLELTVNLNTPSLAAFAPMAGTDLPDMGPLAFTTRLTGTDGTFAASGLQATLEDDILKAEIKGAIDDLAALEGLNLEVLVDTARLSAVLEGFGIEPGTPLPQTIQATTQAEGNLKRLSLKQLQAHIQGEGVTLEGTADVQNIISLAGVSADLALKAESLDYFANIAKIDLPPLGPLQLNTQFESQEENLGGLKVKADLAGQRISASVAGAISDPFKLEEIHADVKLSLANLADFADIANTDLPALGPIDLAASISSKGETYEVNNLDFDLADEEIKATVAGSIGDVRQLAGINADININLDSMASLNALLKQELPDSGPISLAGKLNTTGGLGSPTEIATKLESEGVTLAIEGQVAEPLAANGIDVALDLKAESLKQLGKLTGRSLEGSDPVQLQARFFSKDKAFELSDLTLQAGQLDLKGAVALKPPPDANGRPLISGELHVGNLDFHPPSSADPAGGAQPAPSQADAAPTENTAAPKREKVFPADPLPLDMLKSVDADLAVTIAGLTTLQMQLDDMHAQLTLDNGRLKLEPLQARVGHGTFEGRLTLDAINSPPNLVADIEMIDATFRNFGGKVDFVVDLNGNGESIAAIMAELDGQLSLHISDATLKQSFLTGFGSSLLNSLNPFSKNAEETELTCAVVLFDIEKGIANAERKIAAQMTDVTWLGGGEINLQTEEIDFGVSPKARKGLGISLGSLADLVYIGGTLAQPKIQLDPTDVVTKYGKYSAALATGGITLAVDMLWSKIKANTEVCADILDQLKDDKKPDE